MQALDLPGFWILLKIWICIRDFVLSLICPALIPDTDKRGGKIKQTWEIPGPTIWLPLLGDALALNKFGGPEKILDYISNLHDKYGPIVKTKLGPQKFVFVNHPAIYEEIIRSEPKCPASFKLPASEAFYEKHKINRGLFFQDGEEWRQGRALVTQLLLKETGRFMETLFDSVDPVLQRVMKDWTFKSRETKDGQIQTIEQDCYEFFLSSIMMMTYGQHYETFLSQADSSVATIAREAIKLNAATFDLNAHPIHIATSLGLKCWQEYEEYTLRNLEIGRKCTDLALEKMDHSNGGSLEEFGLLYRMKNVCNASDEEIRVHCTDFTVDISDAVSYASIWTLYALGRNPDVQDKLLQEIEHVCGAEETVAYKDLQKLPYLNATCKEVMRLYTTAQLVIRKNTNMVLGGYNVTSDYIVALSTFSSHTNPLYFSNPEQFWPERWLGEDRDGDTGEIKRTEGAYYPFGIGKRMCAGKHLVQNLLKLFAAKVVQNFVVESDEVGKKLKIILYPDGDMNIRFKPR